MAWFSSNSNQSSQPNIIVFLVDDMGLMDTSVPFITNSAGKPSTQPLNEWYYTPNMEKLASMGTRFSQFYAASVCSPTRASLMTGQNSARHQTTTWIHPTKNNAGEYAPKNWNWAGIRKNDDTLPQVLKANGYKTIHVGKGHFGPIGYDGAEPSNIGFDVNIAGSAWGRPKSYYGQNNYGNHKKYLRKDGSLTHNISHLSAYHGQDVFLTEALTLEANKEIVQSVKNEQPFFLYLSHYAVHDPFESDPRFIHRYQGRGMSKRAQAYASMIEGMDKSLGDVIATLTRLNVAENTVIMFLGDNGSVAPLGGINDIASSAPLKGKKGTSWEGGMRTPLIVSWAELNHQNTLQQRFPILNGQINNQIASVLDIYPTVLKLADVEPATNDIDGFTLTRQLTGDYDKQRENSFLMHFPHPHNHSYFTSYRLNQWKLIYSYNPQTNNRSPQYQLFNLLTDPSESKNLAQSQPKKLANMMQAMNKELDSYNAQYPLSASGKLLKPQLPNSD